MWAPGWTRYAREEAVMPTQPRDGGDEAGGRGSSRGGKMWSDLGYNLKEERAGLGVQMWGEKEDPTTLRSLA